MASNYEQLVKALRCCIPNPPEKCVGCTYNIGNNECAVRRMMLDAAAAIEVLQADIKRLKEVIDELREAQTYIDHYGDRWLTSAKDVPTAAYEHGYADGRGEAEAQLPKRGEIVRCGECKHHLPETERTNPYCNRFHCMKPDDWFCADGVREVQE